MTTAYVTHPRFIEHTLPGHPEHAGRIQSIWQQIEAAQLHHRMQRVTPQPAPDDLLLTVHSQHYLDQLAWATSSRTETALITPDTYLGPTSLEIARLAAGGVARAVDEVLSGGATNALAVVRPPGHHALSNNAMGFCLLGNVAIASKFARQQYGLDRIMIVDFDVHHGNGTQDMLYDDPHTLFISTHQSPFYPGTGKLNETGTGAGQGYTINVPIRAGHADASYAAIFEDILWPSAERYGPELLIVSAGFDAHWDDPLAGMRLSLTGYAHLTRELNQMAEKFCNGKIVFALEGGYNLDALGHGVHNVAHVLLGDDQISDPLGPAPSSSEHDIQALIDRVRRIHNL